MTTLFRGSYLPLLGANVVSIYVYKSSDGLLATLTDAADAPLANPFPSSAAGAFSFKVAPGNYDIVVNNERTRNIRIGWGLTLEDSSSAISASTQLGIPVFTVVNLPATPAVGLLAYASNGRKVGEGAGVGTGVLCYSDSTHLWIACDSGVQVAA